jgi:HD domain
VIAAHLRARAAAESGELSRRCTHRADLVELAITKSRRGYQVIPDDPAGAAAAVDVRTRPAADGARGSHQQIVAGSQHSAQQPQEQSEVETHTDLRSVIIPYLHASISADRVLHPHDRGGKATTATIAVLFGDRVADIVRGCSDSEESENKAHWRQRKEKYLKDLPAAPASVRLVSACDKVHNARAILADLRTHGNDLWPRFKGGKEGSLWYYRSLVEEFKKGGPLPLADELGRVLAEIEQLAGDGGDGD